jgi:hypothetical protein
MVERNFTQYSLSLENVKIIISCLASSAGTHQLFSKAGEINDDHKKNTDLEILEFMLAIAENYPDTGITFIEFVCSILRPIVIAILLLTFYAYRLWGE